MSTVKEKELNRGNQKEKKNLKQLFLWSPSLDTGMAALSQIIIMVLAFLGLKVFGNTILNPILFGLTGTLVVCVIFSTILDGSEKREKYWRVGYNQKTFLDKPFSRFSSGSICILGLLSHFWLKCSNYPCLNNGYLFSMGSNLCLWLASTKV